MAEIIRLGNYAGVVIPEVDVTVLDEELDMVLENVRAQKTSTKKVERPAENGDTVVIDFKGSIDGVYFEGGTGENYSLVLGSGSFIPGFEDQLVGSKEGDHVDVLVPFPENYHSKELAGKDSKFECFVHEVRTAVMPELDDAFAASVSSFKTMEELRDNLKMNMEAQKKSEGRHKRFMQAIEKIAAESEVNVTDEEVEKMLEIRLEAMNQQLAQQGLNLKSYIQYSGMTEEQFRMQLKDASKKDAVFTAILEEVARQENITASEEDIEKEFEMLSQAYRMPADQIKPHFNEEGMNELRMQIMVRKAQNLIVDLLKAE